MTSSFLRALQIAVGAAIGLPLSFTGCDGKVVCEDPQDGAGINGNINATCSNGLTTRPATVSCESTLPSGAMCAVDPMLDSCASDTDCTEQAHGFCAESGGFDGPGGCACNYGCVVDDDCGSDALCICGPDIGHCEAANCRIDGDCGEGHFCARWDSSGDPCSGEGWACTTDEDECTVHADCADALCLFDGTKRACVVLDPCAIGRPFLIDGRARLAGREPRADWAGSTTVVCDDHDLPTRSAVAARWTEIGLMEHASIAAFARFALELLALGAPADLVARAAAAMADETRHAQLAFGIASRFEGAAVGPGPLSLAGALGEAVDATALLRNVFREGCVGESVAALEASEGALRSGWSLLAEIANDEAEHAALAWSSVAWLLSRLGEQGARVLEEELSRAAASPSPAHSEPNQPNLEAFGLLSSGERARLRAQVIETVVAPATRALIERCAMPSARAPRSSDSYIASL